MSEQYLDKHHKTVHSENRRYCAEMDPRNETLTVFELGPDGTKTKLWSMLGWYRFARLSNDGEHLVVGHADMSFVSQDYRRDDSVLYFIRRGEMLKTLTLKDLIDDFNNIIPVNGHMYWGRGDGFESTKLFRVSTAENRHLLYDITTGKKISHPEQK